MIAIVIEARLICWVFGFWTWVFGPPVGFLDLGFWVLDLGFGPPVGFLDLGFLGFGICFFLFLDLVFLLFWFWVFPVNYD